MVHHRTSSISLLLLSYFSQELNSRAQGEVSIREALRELELWGAAATFNFTDYTDSANQPMKLIEEWKDLLNEVICALHYCSR